MQQLFHQLSMEQSYNVGISTLHGNIIHIDVEAQTLVKVFKQQCIDESQLDVAPLKINVDLAGLMIGSDKFTKWEGVRIATLNDCALLAYICVLLVSRMLVTSFLFMFVVGV